MRKENEENLPTEQAQKTTRPRIPRQNGDKEWPQDHSASSSNRPSTLNCLSKKRFPKENRLRKRGEFLSLKRQSKSFYGACVCIDYAFQAVCGPKLGIAASKKYGNACDRNRFKRCAREAFREELSSLPPSLVIQIRPIFGRGSISTNVVLQDLKRLVKKIETES